MHLKIKRGTVVKIRRSATEFPIRKVLKGTSLVVMAPFMILALFVAGERIPASEGLLAAVSIFFVAIILTTPYIKDLLDLTNYVKRLSLDQRAEAPELSFLNNVEELQQGVENLHKSWAKRKAQLESMIAESRVLIDSLPDMLVMLDDNQNIIKTNKAAKNSFGEDYIEKLEEIILRPEVKKLTEEVIKSGKGASGEIIINFDGDEREYIVNAEKIPVFTAGGISIIIDIHDITELKRTEKTFADFVANASHEIRTPLTSIVGFIETLQSGAKDDPEALNKFLGIMSEQGERMTRLVKDLLSLSEIERSIHSAPSEKINLKEVIEEVIASSAWAAKNRGIEIISALPKKLSKTIGDKNQLTQVFENLVGNSIKYAYENSKINLSIEEIKNDGDFPKITSEKIIVVKVEDESEGIPPEHIPRLTERFYRVDKARSRKIGGTGLGLSIVKQIIGRHGGDLIITSTTGKGSIFKVLLPV